jgi:ribosomal protein S18 acetylase RimI-like enzyme
MAEARIRRASIDDAEIIAQLQVDAWRESYASLMPPEALSLLRVEEESERWRDIFRGQASDDASAVFLAMGEDGTSCGFGSCCRQRRPRLAEVGFPAEFSGLYLLRPAQRRGIGRALMGVMAEHLIAKGFSSASVWVFRDNTDARLFYEALGGGRTGIDGEWTILGVTLPDMAYGWWDISKLAAHQ